MNQTVQAVKLDKIIKHTVKHKYIFGAVAHVASGDGAFSWSGAAGNIHQADRYFIASTTKIYISAILLHLRSQGQLQLDDKISQYLPKDLLAGMHVYKDKEYSYDITIRQLMAQTSGLPDYFGDRQKDGKSLQTEITQGNDQAWTLAQVLHRARQMKPKFIPGTKGKAHYSDTNYQLLGKIIATITNENLHAALKKYIFDPLRLSNTYLYTDASDNSPQSLYYQSVPLSIPLAMTSFGPDGGIVSTARESTIFLKAFFKGEFFPVAYLPELRVWNKIFFPLQYGVGMARCKMPWIFSPFQPLPEIIGHSGLSGAFAYYCPEKDMYLTGTVNQVAQPSLSYKLMFKLIASFADQQKICRMYLDGKLLYFLFILFFVNIHAMAQDKKAQPEDSVGGWDVGGTFALNFSESSFSNWNAGGTNSIGLNGIFKPHANIDDTLWTWNNALDLRFGQVKTQDEKIRKSDDLLQLSSKLGRKISAHWEFSGLFTFRSQFAPSYKKSDNKLISTFMAPGYFNLGLGFNYKPNEALSIYLSPLTNRSTYVLNDSLAQAGEFGIPSGKKVKRQLGFSTLITYKQEVIKNVGINTDLSLFSDYLNKPQNIVVNWDFVLTLKANKFLSTTFSCALIYDDNVTFEEKNESGEVIKKIPKIQFKQVLGVGISLGF